jgi:predicted TIM-barrel fold metal-dependent hydrolase
MQQRDFSRRLFLTSVSRFAALVPWSSGTQAPRHKAPPNTADCHHHIYDSRFPIDPNAKLRPGNATVADYRLLQKRLGITRNVIIQPSTYGIDNRCLLDALHQFSSSTTRAIAVVNTAVSDTALRELHAAGVCGIRFNLIQAGATTLEMIEPLARRVAVLGWHIQVNASAAQLLAGMPIWNRLPVPLVFDHLAHVPTPGEPAFQAISRLLQRDKCWVKLSGAYMDTRVGAPTYSDRGAVAKAFIQEAPERLVWGTDWPHPATTDKPDDALLFDLLAQWCGNETVRTRILVQNPTLLYGFS